MTRPVLQERRVAVAPGRRLHLAGLEPQDAAPDAPFVLYDAGAFGIYADGAHVVRALAARGARAWAYSRAGLGDSDDLPGGVVPDPYWHAGDMLRLLERLSPRGPLVLVGHSMAGLRLHALAEIAGIELAGLVLVDAVTPSWIVSRTQRAGTRFFGSALALAEGAVPLARGLAPVYPNGMRLTGKEREDKLRSVASPRHLRTTRAELSAVGGRGLRSRLAARHGVPMIFMPAGMVARGTAALAEEGRSNGSRVEIIDMSGWGHASILSPEPAEAIAEAALRLARSAASAGA
ncbi:alpha/beta fold hydrolase [Parvularcula oceani]|uniref:alpha/beta fold hydrolase n=1 Tax=Parvularcula oceani TaxID=1247963 RepID=UPI00138E2726|nr:alpha/beta fold hydrolase [Parvularcula oceani]